MKGQVNIFSAGGVGGERERGGVNFLVYNKFIRFVFSQSYGKPSLKRDLISDELSTVNVKTVTQNPLRVVSGRTGVKISDSHVTL